jgi:hypothetical protein
VYVDVQDLNESEKYCPGGISYTTPACECNAGQTRHIWTCLKKLEVIKNIPTMSLAQALEPSPAPCRVASVNHHQAQ